jgi:hypothetical protein
MRNSIQKNNLRVNEVLRNKFIPHCCKEETYICMLNANTAVVWWLKDRYKVVKSNSEKIQILTMLLKSWSTYQIETEFGASDYISWK